MSAVDDEIEMDQDDEAVNIPLGLLRRVAVGLAGLAIVVLVGSALFVQRDRIASLFDSSPAVIDTSTYQSVVLTTSQVYFGHLRIQGDFYLLTEVYSLNATDTSSGTMQVVKRGGEVNGPAEPLVIPRHAVLFFENMRPDSTVMNAIWQIKTGRAPTP